MNINEVFTPQHEENYYEELDVEIGEISRAINRYVRTGYMTKQLKNFEKQRFDFYKKINNSDNIKQFENKEHIMLLGEINILFHSLYVAKERKELEEEFLTFHKKFPSLYSIIKYINNNNRRVTIQRLMAAFGLTFEEVLYVIFEANLLGYNLINSSKEDTNDNVYVLLNQRGRRFKEFIEQIKTEKVEREWI